MSVLLRQNVISERSFQIIIDRYIKKGVLYNKKHLKKWGVGVENQIRFYVCPNWILKTISLIRGDPFTSSYKVVFESLEFC